MKQLALALSSPPAPTFDSFVTGRNAELVAMLRAFAAGATAERFIYLWGEAGSGRSHLLAAVAREALEGARPVVLFSAPLDHASLAGVDHGAWVVIDDVDCLDAEGQIELFALYNRIRDGGIGALLAAGGAAPAGLHVRADLATRLAWGLVYEVQALSDEEKAAAMRSHASARGFALPAEVQDYVLRHARRDLPSLLALIEHLDRRSLEQRRPITVPLAREVLQQMQ